MFHTGCLGENEGVKPGIPYINTKYNNSENVFSRKLCNKQTQLMIQLINLLVHQLGWMIYIYIYMILCDLYEFMGCSFHQIYIYIHNLYIYIYIYHIYPVFIYIYICVCVCMCVCI